MNKKAIDTAAIILMLCMLMTVLCGCGSDNGTAEVGEPVVNGTLLTVTDAGSGEEKLSGEQALSAIRNYCLAANPELEDIVDAGEYPVYWDIVSSDEQTVVVLFRSYTGAQIRYYIDRLTGDTRVTEFVPGITSGEQPTDEGFNAWDYLIEDKA